MTTYVFATGVVMVCFCWRESLRRVDVTRSQEFLDRVNLVLVHGVSHARIDPLIDVRVHPAEHVSRFVNSFKRDVWIDIAAAEEHRRAAEVTCVVPRRPRGPDETATQREHTGVSPRVTGREFECQTRTLREPERRDSL